MSKKNMRQEVERAIAKVIRFGEQNEDYRDDVGLAVSKLWSELALAADVREVLAIDNLADRVARRLTRRQPDFWSTRKNAALAAWIRLAESRGGTINDGAK